MQAEADAGYFIDQAQRPYDAAQTKAIGATMLAAYRWQYITSGVQDERFLGILGPMLDHGQAARIEAALAPIVGSSVN